MQNPPILRDGLENADLFPMSGPASWCFLIPKRFCKEVSTHSKKKEEKAAVAAAAAAPVWFIADLKMNNTQNWSIGLSPAS